MRPLTQYLCLFIGLFSIVNLVPDASAQSREAFPEVRNIVPEFKGFQAVSDEYVMSSIRLRPGMEYSSLLLDQSIRALYNTGRFEFVEARVEQVEGNLVDVIFELVSKYTIQGIVFIGNEKYSDSRLLSKGELETGRPLDEFVISTATDAIRDYYVEKGFSDVTVDYRIQRNQERGLATVLFNIDEGDRFKIDKIAFEGNDSFSDRKLKREFEETSEYNWLLSWLTGSGRYDERVLSDDLDLLG